MTGSMAVGANRSDVINGVGTTLIKRFYVMYFEESITFGGRERTRLGAQLAEALGALKGPADDLKIPSKHKARHSRPPLLGLTVTFRLLLYPWKIVGRSTLRDLGASKYSLPLCLIKIRLSQSVEECAIKLRVRRHI